MCLISQDDTEFSVPSYPTRINESEEALRARLTYQSRKRGIAENCLILRFVLYFLFRIRVGEFCLSATGGIRMYDLSYNAIFFVFIFLLVFMLTVGLINLGNNLASGNNLGDQLSTSYFVIFSTFFSEQGPNLPRKIVDQFDILINTVDSDWDLYYWMTGKELPPPPYDNEVSYMYFS